MARLQELDEKLSKAIDSVKDKLPSFLGKSYNEAVKKYWENADVKELRGSVRKPFDVKELGDGVYAIREAVLPVVYLVVGEKKALLVNTGIGFEGLKGTVKELIGDRELLVVCTHASPFTVGGAGDFKEAKLSPSELKAAKLFNNEKLRKVLTKIDPARFLLEMDDDAVDDDAEFKALTEEEIDLGGRKIKVLHTPSDTKSALSFQDDKTEIVFSGNLMGPVALLIFPWSPSLEEYYGSFLNLQKASPKKIYGSFSIRPMDEKRTKSFGKLLQDAVNKGNKTEKFVDYQLGKDKRSLIVFYPWRVKTTDFKTRLNKIVKGK